MNAWEGFLVTPSSGFFFFLWSARVAQKKRCHPSTVNVLNFPIIIKLNEIKLKSQQVKFSVYNMSLVNGRQWIFQNIEQTLKVWSPFSSISSSFFYSISLICLAKMKSKVLSNGWHFMAEHQMQRFSFTDLFDVDFYHNSHLLHAIQSSCLILSCTPLDWLRRHWRKLALLYPLHWKLFNFRSYPATNEASEIW